jgi:sRNA-binding regulator protein Hfq
MSNKNSLIGKSVSFYLDGGWEVSGEIKSSDEDKFIVEKDADLFMVFKNKVSCLLVSEKARAIRPVPVSPPVNKKEAAGPPLNDDALFPMNGISYEESSMSIPGGLLSDAPDNSDDDLSVFFNANDGLEKVSNIDFRAEDDSE